MNDKPKQIDHLAAIRARIEAITPEDWKRVSMVTDSDLNQNDVMFLLARIEQLEDLVPPPPDPWTGYRFEDRDA